MSKRPSRPRRGLRRARSVCLTGLAACAVSAVAVSSAQAAPVPFSSDVNYGYATIGVANPANPLFKLGVLDGTQNATVTGTVETTTGAITAGHVAFPARTFPGAALNPALGASSTITLGFVETPANSLTGQAGPSGALSITGTYLLKLTLANNAISPLLDGECDYTVSDATTPANPLVLSTATTSTTSGFPGKPFNNPDTTGPGSVAGNLHTATTGGPNAGTCGLFNGPLDNKTGDLWLGHNSIPTNGVPFRLTLDHSSLNVGAATGLSIIDPANPDFYLGSITGDTASLTPSTATMSVPGGVPAMSTSPGFHFTPSTGMFAGQTLTVDLRLQNPDGATGTFDTANGHMVLGQPPADLYTAVVTVNSAPGTPECTSTDNPIDFDTAKSGGTNPQAGVAFAGLGGNGALTDDWTSLNASTLTGGSDPNSVCATLNGIAFGLPGGLWVSHGIAPNAPPGGGGGGSATTPPPSGNPAALKKCIKKAKKKFKHNAKKRKKAIKKCKKKFG